MTLTVTEARTPYLNVNEIFGATIQGEGPHTSQRVAFLRLAGCNLSCVWCDTPYSWDWERFDKSKESHRMTIAEIAEAIRPMNVNRIVVTGGEPMIQQRLFKELQEATGCLLDIETNGTKAPTESAEAAVDLFCVSPKLAHAGDSKEQRFKPEALKRLGELAKVGKACFKFVAKDFSDFDEIREFIAEADIPASSVWIMPEGADIETHLATTRKLADAVIGEGWHLSVRVHVLVWGAERGH